MAEDAIDKMKTSSGSVSLVLVGGGSVIIPDEPLLLHKFSAIKMDQSQRNRRIYFPNQAGRSAARCRAKSEGTTNLSRLSDWLD